MSLEIMCRKWWEKIVQYKVAHWKEWMWMKYENNVSADRKETENALVRTKLQAKCGYGRMAGSEGWRGWGGGIKFKTKIMGEMRGGS